MGGKSREVKPACGRREQKVASLLRRSDAVLGAAPRRGQPRAAGRAGWTASVSRAPVTPPSPASRSGPSGAGLRRAAERPLPGAPRRKELRRLRPGSSETDAVQPAGPGLRRGARPRRRETRGGGVGAERPGRDQGSRRRYRYRRGQQRLPGRVSQELRRRSSGKRRGEEGRPSAPPRPPLRFPGLALSRPGDAPSPKRVGGGGCAPELAPLGGRARGAHGGASVPRGCDEGKSCGGERQADVAPFQPPAGNGGSPRPSGSVAPFSPAALSRGSPRRQPANHCWARLPRGAGKPGWQRRADPPTPPAQGPLRASPPKEGPVEQAAGGAPRLWLKKSGSIGLVIINVCK